MEMQLAFNIAVGLISFLGGWILNSINKRIESNEATMETMRIATNTDIHGLRNKVQAIEVVLAGNYVKKEDLEKLGNSIFTKLDKIEERISSSRVIAP